MPLPLDDRLKIGIQTIHRRTEPATGPWLPRIAELVELVWVEIGSEPLADAHAMTKNVLAELDRRLATGPLSHDAPVPFFHFYGGKMQKDVLGETS